MNLTHYFLHASLIAMAVIGVCQVVLKNDNNFRGIRLFLLTGLLLISLLPLYKVSYDVNIEYPTDAVSAPSIEKLPINDQQIQKPTVPTELEEKPTLNLYQSLLFIYYSGILYFLVRIVFYLILIFIRYHQSSKELWNGITVCIHPKTESPFVIGRVIFVNSSIYLAPEKRDVLVHESIHLRQNHWIDIVLCEFMIILFWFNPLVWYYKRLVSENLEYLADRGVLEEGIEKESYLKSIICETMGAEAIVLANYFRNSRNKKRLKMMKNQNKNKWQQLKMLFLLPAIGVSLWAFSEPNYVMVPEKGNNQFEQVNDSLKEEFVLTGYVTYIPPSDTVEIRLTDGTYRSVIDRPSRKFLKSTVIRNLRSGEEMTTGDSGKFSMRVKLGDYLDFNKEGYFYKDKQITNKEKLFVALNKFSKDKTKDRIRIKVRAYGPPDTLEVRQEDGSYKMMIVGGSTLHRITIAEVGAVKKQYENEGIFELETYRGANLEVGYRGYKSEQFIADQEGKIYTVVFREKAIFNMLAGVSEKTTNDTIPVRQKDGTYISKIVEGEIIPLDNVKIKNTRTGEEVIVSREFKLPVMIGDHLVFSKEGYENTKYYITYNVGGFIIDIKMKRINDVDIAE